MLRPSNAKLTLATLSLTIWLPLNAEHASASEAIPREGLEEVIVTARKREESLQDIPVAVTALTAEDLRERSVQNAYDLMLHAPGLEIRSASSTRYSVDYFIRGQGSTGGAGPAVVQYFSQVPLPNYGGVGTDFQFFDLASVQVLKGPQGTLFGRSSTGGAVLFEPQRPTTHFEGFAKASAGNLNWREFTGAINVPLLEDKLQMRFAANVVRRDGFTTSLNTGQELDDRHREAYRLGLNFTPTDWLESYFMLQDTRSNEASTGTVLIAFNPNIPQFNTGPTGAGRLAITGICGALNPGNPGGRADCIDTRVARMNTLVSSLVAEEARVRAGGDDAIRHNQTALRGGVSSHTQQILNITSAEAGEASFLGEVTVKNIFSTTRTRGYPILREIGGSPVPHGVVYNQYDLVGGVPAVTKRSSGREDFMDNFTEEFQILGSINDRHNWILGYYLEEVHDDLAYPALFASFGNVFSASLDTPGLTGVLNGDSVTVLKGYFGQFTADLSDWLLQGLRFTGGYRWSESHFRFTNLGIVPTAAGLVPGPNPVPGPAVNDQAPSWNVSFDYQFDPALMVYLAHRRGFKPGGRNIVPPSIPGARQTFAPETLDDIEFGVKYDWRLGDRAARTNLSLYKQWYADIQRREVVQNPLPPFETVTQVNNLASADIEGLELENVLQLTDRLTLSFNYAYINAEYSKWPGVALVNGQAIPLVKSPYVGTPEHQGSIGVRYRLPVPEAIGELTAAADYFRQTDVWLNDQALQDGFVASKQDGYGNLNLRLDWANVGGHPVDAAVFVRNATDDVHLISSGSLYTNLGVIVGVYNEPRTWGAELRYRFGE